jgi:hypothetical protein
MTSGHGTMGSSVVAGGVGAEESGTVETSVARSLSHHLIAGIPLSPTASELLRSTDYSCGPRGACEPLGRVGHDGEGWGSTVGSRATDYDVRCGTGGGADDGCVPGTRIPDLTTAASGIHHLVVHLLLLVLIHVHGDPSSNAWVGHVGSDPLVLVLVRVPLLLLLLLLVICRGVEVYRI